MNNTSPSDAPFFDHIAAAWSCCDPIPSSTSRRASDASSVSERIQQIAHFSDQVSQSTFKDIKLTSMDQLKKERNEAQRLLKSSVNETEREILQKVIENFDKLQIPNQVFRELAELGDLLQDWSRSLLLLKPSDKFSRSPIYRKYVPHLASEIKATDLAAREPMLEIRKDPARWTKFRERIWKAAQESEPTLLEGRRITWLTGSRSAAIPMIEQVANTALSTRPALVPTGKLLEHNIVPLCGELGWGLQANGVNRRYLSGVEPNHFEQAFKYAEETAFIFKPEDAIKCIESIDLNFLNKFTDSLLRLKIAVLRLIWMGAHQQEWERLKEHIQKNIFDQIPPEKYQRSENYDRNASLIGKEVPSDYVSLTPRLKDLQIGQIVGVERGWVGAYFCMLVEIYEDGTCLVISHNSQHLQLIYQDELKTYSEEDIVKLAKEQEPLSEGELAQVKRVLQPLKSQVEEVIHLFDTFKPEPLSVESHALIKESFPVIWASTSLKNLEVVCQSDIKGELPAEGILDLGKDIQLAFTPEEHVDQLRLAVEKHDVKVLSFDAAFYIFSQQLVYNDCGRHDPADFPE